MDSAMAVAAADAGTPSPTILVDACGLTCPMPIVNTARAMRRLPPGALIEVLATDAGASEDFDAWCLMTGNQLLERSACTGVHRFLIRKR
jgi:tRNA 2-thiouridine synthesizing protein A